jgi:GNAT superfamily N-acetyltransferase
MSEGYEIVVGYPPINEYLNIREASGLSKKTEAQAAHVATGSWFGVYAVHIQSRTIAGMGRIIGDGGWYFHIADMAVLPDHQRKGLGDAILKRLLEQIDKEAPPKPFVCLSADPPGQRLYARNGFVETAPVSVGMALPSIW